jgi:ferredoxin
VNYTLFYYSGAGNTEYISRQIKRAIAARGHDVSMKRITLDTLDGADNGFDAAGVGFPIHFRDAPELVHDFLDRLDGRNRSIFFYCTKGLYSGNAMRHILALSERRSFVPRGVIEFTMPGTDALLFFAAKGSNRERLLKAIYTRKIASKIEDFVARLGAVQRLTVPREKWYTGIDEKIVEPLEIRANNAYRDFIGQFHTIGERCNECLLCVNSCPRNNIRLSGDGIQFRSDCDVCLRCIHRCPTEAIQIGTKTLNTVRWNPAKEWRSDREGR